MKKSFSRVQRVGELIQTVLATIIQDKAEELHLGMVTITSVTVSPDFSHARIFVSVLEESRAKDTIATLNEAGKTLRYELAHAIKLRVTPMLRFVFDDSTVRGSRISSLINDALKRDPSDDDK